MKAFSILLCSIFVLWNCYALEQNRPEENSLLTVAEYTQFLNSEAPVDCNQLYDVKMASELGSSSIVRLQAANHYSYYAAEGVARDAATFLSHHNFSQYQQWKKISSFHSSSNLDEDLKSNRITFLLSSSKISTTSPNDTTFQDSLRIGLSAFVTVCTLLSEGHFSLERARREVQEPIIEANNANLITECYSSKSVRAGILPDDILTLLHAERESLTENLPEAYSEHYQEAIRLEQNLKKFSEQTFLNQLKEAAKHFGAGFGRIAGLFIHTVSPILDNSRRLTAGGIVGYSLGALVAYLQQGNFFDVLSDGMIGSFIGAGPLFVEHIYDTYVNWDSYCHALYERHQAMKVSFSLASETFWNAWQVEAKRLEAKKALQNFYVTLSETLQTNHSKIPEEYYLLLLEAHAQKVLEASPKEYSFAFKEWTQKGRNFYGPEIMDYAFPEGERNVAVITQACFSKKKNEVLLRARGALIAFKEHWSKSTQKSEATNPKPIDRFKSLTLYTEDLKNRASNDLVELENNTDYYCNIASAIGSLFKETLLLKAKILTMSLLGFLTGSFIGNAIPFSLSLHDFSWAGANSTALAYSAYFLCVDLSNSKNMIRESARTTTEAYARLNSAWNKPYKIKEATAKYNHAIEDHQRALTNEKVAQELIKQQQLTDNSQDVFVIPNEEDFLLSLPDNEELFSPEALSIINPSRLSVMPRDGVSFSFNEGKK